jgi:lipopolysaccharide transport system permease protein
MAPMSGASSVDLTRHGRGLDMTAAPASLRQMAGDLRRSSSLIMILARKDFYVRYRRASLGLFWAVGLPLIQTATLALVFSQVRTFQISGVPYPVFIFSGMLPWTYFASTFTIASTSVVDNANLSNKIYFPRSVLPIVTIVSGLYGFTISLVLLLGAALVYDVGIGPEILVLVPAVALLVLITLGFSLVCTALHVYFRDLRYIVQATVGAWFYITPVVYNIGSRTLSDTARAIVRYNPMTGVIELFRYAVLGSDGLDPGWETSVVISCATAAVLLVVAVVLHRRYDRVFSDLL